MSEPIAVVRSVTQGFHSFSGELGMKFYTCVVLAHALRFYAKTGMKVNSAYTPTNMIRKANELTGCVFRRGQYQMAAEACLAEANRIKPLAIEKGEIS